MPFFLQRSAFYSKSSKSRILLGTIQGRTFFFIAVEGFKSSWVFFINPTWKWRSGLWGRWFVGTPLPLFVGLWGRWSVGTPLSLWSKETHPFFSSPQKTAVGYLSVLLHNIFHVIFISSFIISPRRSVAERKNVVEE